ncbi:MULTISPECIES: murein hydrolase activator EnvC [unclassified Oceanobacter]|uniref:murein hydrolase activator EnvC family protein n=1 Tax=unclassified Oceanobacter TaxID=2620260 RepID=UPI0027337483|nr:MULTISPECIES: peptidoglycan DD-metalloendopeptidase family protein [unclassified Oceanobacter]MDP2607923.1 peptidoglycan DD-metalloendopeptidase family protein [Oceanobacter sp. 1_MG-2023]MDP2611415.1 peptidoglycan DD-metalloendopeptidase family protein [Oceanobacter sp. 2_MG-2023]
MKIPTPSSLLLTCLLSLATTLPVVAEEAGDAAKLQALKQDIAKLQQWLNEASAEHSKLSESLRNTDQDIGTITRKIEETRRLLKEEQDRLKKLRQDQAQLNELRSWHTLRLKEQLQAAYRLGGDSPIKMLLNQDDSQQAQRMLSYFGYFNRARMEEINHTLSELTRLEHIADEIITQEQQLQRTQQSLDQKNRQLTQQKKKQNRLLAQLSQQMTSEKSTLARKQADRKRLESLFDEVQTLVEKSPRKQDVRPFKALKRSLPRPLAGRIIAAYGNPNTGGVGRWEGWLIAAPEGTNIQAVHHGRVVYSDWLRGFGLLMILDHGDGYMTLYAHNQTLMYDVGAWVNQGDVIGAVGRSGGLQEPRLYFEIRHRGKPLDPAAWLVKR